MACHEFEHKGIQDEEITSSLHRLRRPTFFTRDLGFYAHSLCHMRYCLVCMAVEKYEVASFVRRFLRHPEFDTQAKRMGAVTLVSHTGILMWRLQVSEQVRLSW